MLKQVQIDWNEVQWSAIEYNRTAPTQNRRLWTNSTKSGTTKSGTKKDDIVYYTNYFLSFIGMMFTLGVISHKMGVSDPMVGILGCSSQVNTF